MPEKVNTLVEVDRPKGCLVESTSGSALMANQLQLAKGFAPSREISEQLLLIGTVERRQQERPTRFPELQRPLVGVTSNTGAPSLA